MLSAAKLTGVRIKIERAREHIDQLRTAIDPMLAVDLKSRPYRLFVEVDPNSLERVVRLAVLDNLDPRLGAIAGDAVHNLRSALDLLVWQLVTVNGGSPGDHTAFPVGRSKQGFETALPGCVKGSAPSVHALLQQLQPYKGGNDAIWRIHRIDVVDKHHVLIPAGAVVEAVMVPDGIRFDGAGRRILPNLLPGYSRVPAVDRAELVRLPPDEHEVNVHPEGICEITFAEPEVVAGEPMIPTLSQLANYVEGVAHAFAILP